MVPPQPLSLGSPQPLSLVPLLPLLLVPLQPLWLVPLQLSGGSTATRVALRPSSSTVPKMTRRPLP
ncbi:hypothetical protein L083_1015 [Actinoplanes sp. N902-109]|nr:hypothetical protein L083_1015 [Actinoplanes sp. N902-109]